MREDVLTYYQAIYKLGRETLFPLFALALDLDREHFTPRTAKGSSAAARMLYYPPQTGVVDERVMGIGAHSDCVSHPPHDREHVHQRLTDNWLLTL